MPNASTSETKITLAMHRKKPFSFVAKESVNQIVRWLKMGLGVFLLAALLEGGALAEGAASEGKGINCVSAQLLALFVQNRFAEAEVEFKKMLESAIAKKDIRQRICARHALAGAQGKQEKIEEALANSRALLEDAKANLPSNDTQLFEAQLLLASIIGRSGDRGNEIRIYNELLPAYERKYGQNSYEAATLLRNLATAHAWVGNHVEVVRLDRRVLEIITLLNRTSMADQWRKNNIPSVAKAQIHLAESLLALKEDGDEAFRLSTLALPEMKVMLGDQHPEVLNAELTLATAMRKTGDMQGAISLERKTLETARSKLGDAHSLSRKAANNLAVSLSLSGSNKEAIELDHKQLASLIAIHGAGHPETIRAFTNHTITLNKTGRHDEAILSAEEGLRSMLAIRRTLDFDARITTAWQKDTRRLVEAYLFALIKNKRYPDAFLVAEFFKARQLADRLTLDAGELRLPEEQRKQYRSTLRELSRVEQELAIRRNLNQRGMDMAGLEAKRQRAADAVRLAGAGQGKPVQVEVLPTAKDFPPWASLVRTLAEEKTAYVSFIRINGWLYALSFPREGGMLLTQIAPAEKFQTLVAATRHLIGPVVSQLPNKKKVWKASDGKYRIAETSQDGEIEIRDAEILLEEMANQLLKPLAPSLADRQGIVFSPDDVLAHVPFAALPYKGKALVESFRIALVPSLETLQRIRVKARQTSNIALRPVLAFGGARYERLEKYSELIYIQHEKPALSLMDIKAIRQAVGKDIRKLPLAMAGFAVGMPNLPGSEEDAKQVAQGFGGDKAGAIALTRELATEAMWNTMADQARLAQYRVIHFSAHGFLSDDDPALSAIVLGQIKRTPDTDGYLTAAELSSVNLNSDLVVVSTCNSGVSGFTGGEGIMGIAHALFEAGTHHSLLTLWPIGDRSSTKFMEKFYEFYRNGEPAPAALASAQRWAIGKGWDTRDWAAYVLHGY